jgi:DNA-binding transcriptional ArsR family regulator
MANLQSSLEATGDPTRFAILECLAHSPQAVVDLARRFPVSRPAVSQHLRVLKDAGLIVSEREGRRTVYRADPKGLAELRAHFDRMWSDALASFKNSVESIAKSKKENHRGRNRRHAHPKRSDR